MGLSTKYERVHEMLSQRRGRASAHSCEDCGVRMATEWAYDHSLEDPPRDQDGQVYTFDLSRYRALCRSCHVQLDQNHGTTFGRRSKLGRSKRACL